MKKLTALAFGILLSVAAYADGPGRSKKRVEGGEALKNNTALFSQISWHDALKPALSEAAKSKRLVFWMHVKGEFDGVT